MHRSYGLQGSLKRRYKHPSPTSINGYHTAKKLLSQSPAKRPTFAFTGESGYTLAFANRIAHSGLHAETGAVSDGGAITTLGAFHTFRKPCVARCQNGKLCRFCALIRCAPEERREPSEQRCAYARRCSEAPRPRWAALLCLQFGDVAVFSLCAQGFPHMRKRGWYHYPRCALRAAETPDGRLSKRLICRFLRSGGHHWFQRCKMCPVFYKNSSSSRQTAPVPCERDRSCFFVTSWSVPGTRRSVRGCRCRSGQTSRCRHRW